MFINNEHGGSMDVCGIEPQLRTADVDDRFRQGLPSGQLTASLAIEYGFTDIDGKAPRPLTLADV